MNCSICAAALSVRNVTGLCRTCANRKAAADPVKAAKRLAGLRAKWVEPEYRAKMAAKGRAHAYRLMNDEGVMERRRAAASRVMREVLMRPDIRARTLEAVRQKTGKTQSAQRIAWCPPEYRDLYWFMRRTKRLPLAECKEVIAEQIRADRAKLSPFERQMADLEAKVKNGTQDIGVLEGGTGTAFHLRSVGRRG